MTAPGRSRSGDLDRLAEVPLEVTVELARLTTTLGEALTLAPGSLLTFQPHDAARVEVVIGKTRVALGEPITVDDQLGVRITDLLPRATSN